MILKNTNPQLKITNWSFYHQLVISTFNSLLEMFGNVGFNEDSDADIKMFVVHRENWTRKTLCENLVECPECAEDFNIIAQLETHDRYLSCHQCGKCLKEGERPHSDYCLPEDTVDKTPITEHHALQLKLRKEWGLAGT